jgi:hypothetical protein
MGRGMSAQKETACSVLVCLLPPAADISTREDRRPRREKAPVGLASISRAVKGSLSAWRLEMAAPRIEWQRRAAISSGAAAPRAP